ncbi:MAG: hypothetical protein Q4D74_01115, partial [Comamonadaceae bacterium]|nr:hypothetical protein [Comamonadaceae bacterium]
MPRRTAVNATPHRTALQRQWARLHVLDAEPWPRGQAQVQSAWAAFHAGDFARAESVGVQAGGAGLSAANRAAAAHATLVEPAEKARLETFRRVHARARTHAALMPRHPNAWFWQGYALWRYAQGIGLARALAQGLGTQARTALEKTLVLAPRHVFAHLALGSYHAEVIDKLGPLVSAMAYGASAATARHHLGEALRLAPDAA